MASQYGEEVIISQFFQSVGFMSEGYLVEAGAADGEDNSNTHFLINSFGWRGILIEPNPRDFDKLKTRYMSNPRLNLLNIAVLDEEGTLPFYVEPGQASTLSTDFKARVERFHHAKYDDPIEIQCLKLKTILDIHNSPLIIDFMSIDCEGVDMRVLNSMDWDKYKVRFLCVEHSMPKQELKDYLTSKGYDFVTETSGNSFFSCRHCND